MSHLSHQVFWTHVFGAFAVVASSEAHAGPVVETAFGAVSGIAFDDRAEFRGIPYAEPPVGHLRWARSIPHEAWSGVRDATEFGSYCTQPVGFDEEAQQLIFGGSEDCLFLNVTVPDGPVPPGGFSVLVDIHGGGNTYGSAQEDASYIARKGIIVVTMNYRLGVFGFVTHPALVAEAGLATSNYGLYDQILALQWVQETIASFGGNPDNVTLSGFSAGAGDTIALMASPLTDGLFERAFPNAFGYWQVYGDWHSLADIEQIGVRVSEGLGCESTPDPLACMRSRTTLEVATAYGGDSIAVTHGVETIPKPVIQLLRENGSVPAMIGQGAEEDGWLYYEPFLTNPMSHDELVKYIGDWLFVRYGNEAERRFYNEDIWGTNWQAYVHFQTDLLGSCPMRAAAKAPRPATWRYVLTHRHSFIEHSDEIGAAHGTDTDMFWGWSRDYFDDTEAALSDQMVTYLANFVEYGDPNGPGLPVWPAFDPEDQGWMEFADTPVAHDSGGFRQQECDFLDQQSLYVDCRHLMLCRWIDGPSGLNPRILLQVGYFDRGRFGMEDKDVGNGRF